MSYKLDLRPRVFLGALVLCAGLALSTPVARAAYGDYCVDNPSLVHGVTGPALSFIDGQNSWISPPLCPAATNPILSIKDVEQVLRGPSNDPCTIVQAARHVPISNAQVSYECYPTGSTISIPGGGFCWAFSDTLELREREGYQIQVHYLADPGCTNPPGSWVFPPWEGYDWDYSQFPTDASVADAWAPYLYQAPQLVSVPYFRRPGTNTASDLMKEIGGGPITTVASVTRLLAATDTLQVYTGRRGTPAPNYSLQAGEAYRVGMLAGPLPGVPPDAATVSGRVIRGNGSGLQSRFVRFQHTTAGAYFALTDGSGFYQAVFPPGDLTTFEAQAKPGETFVPSTRAPLSLSAGGTVTGQDFVRTPLDDLGVTLYAQYTSPDRAPCPGVAMKFCVRYSNLGDISHPDARVRLVLDASFGSPVPLPPVCSSAAPSATNVSGNTITWTIPGFDPDEACTVCVGVTTTASLGAATSASADVFLNPGGTQDSVTGGLSNNTSPFFRPATCSHDPNDKQVEPEGCGASGFIPSGKTLTYLVRFQNTGNAPATNVVVRDFLNENVDVSSLEIVDASHPLSSTTLSLGRLLTFSFLGINLPDSGSNEPASHGFVLFTLRPAVGLPPGAAFSNRASIFFDNNEPVVTNVVLNAMAVDGDGDGLLNPCDNCPALRNESQSDFDQDGEGDACDLNDGRIVEFFTDRNHIVWQAEAGFSSWNVYEGDLDVLKSTGVYTQAPGSNPRADRHCSLATNALDDFDQPSSGKTVFSLVTGVQGGVEGSLGQNSHGIERPNANPCP